MQHIIFLITEDWYFISHRLNFAKILIKNGFKVSLITRISNYKNVIEENGINLVPISWKRKTLSPVSTIYDTYNIHKILIKLKPDILHNVALKPVIIGSLASFGIPYMKIINAITGLGYLFINNEGIRKFMLGVIMSAFKLIFKSNRVSALFQNHSDIKYMLRSGIITEDQYYLIKGVGVKNRQIVSMNKNKTNKHNILFASRMIWSKGVEIVVKVAELYNGNKNVHFFLAGKPDYENPDSVSDEQLKEWNKKINITWLNHVDDMENLYKTSDIFILPTTYGEGIPKVLLEAGSYGIPIITSNQPGCNEFVKHGQNGYLLDSLEPDVIKHYLDTLIKNNELRFKMGRLSQTFIKKEFSEEHILRQVLEIHKKILSDV